MKKYEVESSNIDSITYEIESKELIVTFKSGASYSYADVDPDALCRLMFADSIGKVFNDSIKKYKFTKVE